MNNYTSELRNHMVNIWMVWESCMGAVFLIDPTLYHTLALEHQ